MGHPVCQVTSEITKLSPAIGALAIHGKQRQLQLWVCVLSIYQRLE